MFTDEAVVPFPAKIDSLFSRLYYFVPALLNMAAVGVAETLILDYGLIARWTGLPTPQPWESLQHALSFVIYKIEQVSLILSC